MPIRSCILTVLLFHMIPFTVAETESRSAATADQAPYDILLSTLRNSDSVIPPEPPVHEVAAMYNREAVIPPQCYTRTEGEFNPCYVCHQDSRDDSRENRMNDRELQVAYSFSSQGAHNHWRNLFEDRSARVAAISDRDISRWVGTDNYSALRPRLEEANFKGWIPDLENLQKGAPAFDDLGFALDGSHWVAFNYKPMPSTFWPTNGSTDDVMIRLARPFRSDTGGNYSRDVYIANLAIVEASIKGLSRLEIPPVDERRVGADLDGDGRLATATVLRKVTAYVGAAGDFFFEAGIYPLDTEFLHTVRYLGIGEDGTIGVSIRMKEVRYMRKTYVLPKFALAHGYREEHWAKAEGKLPQYIRLGQKGLDNEMGWQIQGFIEDSRGRLRANTYEETMFCMGCHTSIGATIDKTFSFPRKVDGVTGWGYIDLKGMADAPNRGESRGEIATYLERVGGNEFRNNRELLDHFFDAAGDVNREAVEQAGDVYGLITPSVGRALALNKAYKTIVEDQDYIFGREAIVSPPRNVYRDIDNSSTPTLPESITYDWDIRLDWQRHSQSRAASRHADQR